MKFTRLVTSVFYSGLADGLNLFVDCLKFSVQHQELNISQPYCFLGKDDIRIMLFQNDKLAKEHYPEIRLETSNLLHPNLDKVTLRPWGAKEFAIKDNQIGIRFQQW